MKKVVKIMAGLLLGLVIVAGVKTEAKAASNTDVLKLLGYQTSSNNSVNLWKYAGVEKTGFSALDAYAYSYAQAMYEYEMAMQAYTTMIYVQEQYLDAYNYLNDLAKQTQPYVNLYGGTNPYSLAMKELAMDYNDTMKAYLALFQ